MQNFTAGGIKISYEAFPADYAIENTNKKDKNKPLIVWAHGWGQNHQSFKLLITPLSSRADHIALDLPGFGESDMPPEDWGTKEYADAIAQWIKAQNLPPVIWIGHSFGCRVGVQLAAHYPELVSNMAFISGAGLKRTRPLHQKVYFYCRIKLFKTLRKIIPEGSFKQSIMAKFGSADYKTSGALRNIFIRVVNEDLSLEAQKITCPVTLIYGQNDTETPPKFGHRYSDLIKDSKLHLLEGQDHYSVLQSGRHPVIKILNDMIKAKHS